MIVNRIETSPFLVKISMGKPSFRSADFGVLDGSETFLAQELETTEGTFTVSSCFIGHGPVRLVSGGANFLPNQRQASFQTIPFSPRKPT